MWRLAEDTLSQEDLDTLADWLRDGPRLTQDGLVREFERAWSDWLGARESVFMSSGTTANFALVLAASRRVARTRPRIGIAAVTWSTNVSPSMLLGHEVVVFDVDPRTLGVDETQVIRAIEQDRIDILFVTHLLGLDALTPAILDAVEASDVILIEDCCEAHGARHGDRKVGTLGIAGTFSFYYGHHMSTIEGGMVSTDDEELADELRLIRAHGLARESTRFDDLAARYPDIDPRFLFVTTGLNFRSTELNAFLGLRQLETLDERIEQRNTNLAHFLDRLPSPWWSDFRTDGVSSFALPLIAHDMATRVRAVEAIAALGIESRPVVAGNLLAHPFVEGQAVMPFDGSPQVAEQIHRTGLYIGNGHHVTTTMVDALCDELGRIADD